MKFIAFAFSAALVPCAVNAHPIMIDTLTGKGCLAVNYADVMNPEGNTFNVQVVPECTGEAELIWNQGPSNLYNVRDSTVYCMAVETSRPTGEGERGLNVIVRKDNCEFDLKNAWRPGANSSMFTSVEGKKYCLAMDDHDQIGFKPGYFNVMVWPDCDGSKGEGWYSHGKEPEGLIGN